MKYVALLRGINVGGNNIISMIQLKESFEKNGFTNVITYINSGNVIFESDEKNIHTLTEKIEEILSKAFHYEAKIVLRSYPQLKKILDEAPSDWKSRKDIRMNIAFLKEPLTEPEAMAEIVLKEDIDLATPGDRVIYMSTLLSKLTKSYFSKLVAKKSYKLMTIRTYNTSLKILALMEKNT